MPLLASRYSRRRIQFIFLTALAVAGSVGVMSLAPKSYYGAEEVAYLPLFLTGWIGGSLYRQLYGGHRWWWRTGTAMSVAAALGGILALAVLGSWTPWPGFFSVAYWLLVVVGSALLFGILVVGLASLDRRRLTRLRWRSARGLWRPHRRLTPHHR
jgi:hypothetical protein